MSARLNWIVPVLVGLACIVWPQQCEAQLRKFNTVTDSPLTWAGTVDLLARGRFSTGAFAGVRWNVGIDYNDFELLDISNDDIRIEAKHLVRPHGRIDGPGAGPQLTAYLYEVDDGVNVGPATDFQNHGVHTDLLRASYNAALGRIYIVTNHDRTRANRRRLNVDPQENLASLAQNKEIQLALGTATTGPLQQGNIRIANAVGFQQGQPMPLDVQAVAYDSGDGDPQSGFFGPEQAAASFMQLETYLNPGPQPVPEAGVVALQLGLHDLNGQPMQLPVLDAQVDVAPDGQRYDGEVIMGLPGVGEQHLFISGQVEEGQEIAFQSVNLQPMFMPGADGDHQPMRVDLGLRVAFMATGQYNPAESLWRTSLMNDYSVFGDLDGDDVTDGQDIALWSAGYGVDGDDHHPDGDADGDGDVDGIDFLFVQRHHGANLAQLLPAGGPAVVSSVPEPSSLVIVSILTLAGMVGIRRR